MRLEDLEVGDYIESIDKTVEKLNEATVVEYDYNNVYTNAGGYLAEITRAGDVVAHVESVAGNTMVKNIRHSNIPQP